MKSLRGASKFLTGKRLRFKLLLRLSRCSSVWQSRAFVKLRSVVRFHPSAPVRLLLTVNMITEERKNVRSALVFILFTLAIILGLIFYGVPLVTKITSFVTGLRKQSAALPNNNLPPPAPVTFDSLPEAINKTPLKVSGSVQPGNTVVLNFNGGENEIAADENGIFSISLEPAKGDNSLFAYAKGPTGKLSQKSAVYAIIFDNEAPKIEISTPPDGAKYYGTKQQNATIKGTTETGSTLSVNGRLAVVNDDGAFSSNYTLDEGENNLSIKAIDRAGNESETSLKLYFYP